MSATGSKAVALTQALADEAPRTPTGMTEVDRVLAKVHDQGLASLNEKEKRILRDASQRQREEEQTIYRS